MDTMSPMEMPNGVFPIRKKKKRGKRKLHGVLFIRNLRTGVKSRFKAKCSSRADNMTDAIEALMLLYIDKPEIINDLLMAVKSDRRKMNMGRGG